MKTVLLSIKPKWCELIASGKKTVEVRKTRPKLETPFRCYIYETKGKSAIPTFVDEEGHEIYDCGGKVIGEFVCDEIEILFNTNGNPKNYIKEILPNILQKVALSYDEFKFYTNTRADRNNIYGWHISDLKIYDEPRRVTEFWHFGVKRGAKVTRPPQSWCYVEEYEAEGKI